LGDAFNNAVFRAYFVDSKNIGKIEILADLAAQVGLSESEAKRVIEGRTFADAVEKDWSRSMEIDPEYIPSILLNGHLLVNPQKYDLYERFMEQNRIKKRIPNR
jgi:predicted DsbA family dithiol-disulfide isomerase